VAVVLILPDGSQGVESGGAQGGLERLRRLRVDLYGCFARRPDALFELCDAMLCAPGPVVSPVELSLEPEFRRRHAMVYNALVWGVVDAARLRRTLVGMLPRPRAGEPAMFAVDVSPVPRPDPRYVDGLSMVQVRGAGGDRFLPGWPLSVLVGLEWGACSWVDPLDVRRIRPGEDHTRVLIEQVEGLVGDLQVAGRAASGGAVPLVMFDAGYPASRIAHEVCGSGVQVLGRVRSDRVFYFPAPVPGPGPGRRACHGARFACSEAQTHPVPDVRIAAESERYGRVRVAAWHGLHQALTRTGAWADHPPGDLPIVSGTLICVVVDRLPHDGKPKPVWLWHCAPPGTAIDVDLLWKAYLRRFDQETGKPECCHIRVVSTSSAVPSSSVLMLAA